MNQLRERSHSNRLLVWVTLPPAFVLAVSALSILGSSTPNHTPPPSNLASSAGKPFLLEISPDPVSLGVVSSGQKARASLTLLNRGPQPVTVERIDTGCPCLRTKPEWIRIAPGEAKVLAVEFDPSAEPDFRGGLSIVVTGWAAGQVAFHTQVKLEVPAEAPKGVGKLAPYPNEEGGA